MHTSRRALLAAAIVCSAAAVPGAAVAAASQANSLVQRNSSASPATAGAHNKNLPDSTVSNQQRVRVEFGLRSDLPYIAEVDAQVTDTNSELGIPLTSAEQTEMARRDALLSQLSLLGGKLSQSESSTYSGVWLDQAAGGVPVIASTAPAGVDQSLVKVSLPAGTVVRIQKETYSLQYLNTLADRIQSDEKSGATAFLMGAAVGTFPMQNEVHVDLAPSSSPADVSATYSRYGTEGLTVDSNGPQLFASRYDTNGPVYGGKEINQGPYNACTASPSASGYGYYAITAGHCSPNKSTPWYLGDLSQGQGGSIGTSFDNGFYDQTTTYCDCTGIGPLPAGDSTTYAIVDNGQTYQYYNYADTNQSLCNLSTRVHLWRVHQCGGLRSD